MNPPKRRKVVSYQRIMPEIWTRVFEYLGTTKDFYALYFLDKDTHDYPWKQVLNSLNFQLNFFLKSDFISLGLHDLSLVNRHDFSYVDRLDLSQIINNQIYYIDEFIALFEQMTCVNGVLRGIRWITLNYSVLLTEEMISQLKGFHTLSLYGCTRIDDSYLKHLNGIHSLDLTNSGRITDKALGYLTGIHTLNLTECEQITDLGLATLRDVKVLNLTSCGITDRGLQHLHGVYDLNLSKCKRITDKCLGFLKGVQILKIEGPRFTDEGLECLKGIQTLKLENCCQITAKGITSLRKIHSLEVINCMGIDFYGIDQEMWRDFQCTHIKVHVVKIKGISTYFDGTFTGLFENFKMRIRSDWKFNEPPDEPLMKKPVYMNQNHPIYRHPTSRIRWHAVSSVNVEVIVISDESEEEN